MSTLIKQQSDRPIHTLSNVHPVIQKMLEEHFNTGFDNAVVSHEYKVKTKDSLEKTYGIWNSNMQAYQYIDEWQGTETVNLASAKAMAEILNKKIDTNPRNAMALDRAGEVVYDISMPLTTNETFVKGSVKQLLSDNQKLRDAKKDTAFVLTGLYQYWVKPASEKDETYHWIKVASKEELAINSEIEIAGARYFVLYKIL